jgi:peptidoglycan/xylan/chitin deacetylase (PgdA/CDA1 family)
MNQLVLKVDVDTYLGTLRGVPALLDLFQRFDVRATFLFSLGPDHTGRAIRRVFRKGFLRKVSRTSVLSHYGIRTLMNGVLLPGPHIGKRAAHIMRQVQQSGHEVGIHCYDHVLWQDNVAGQDREWTRTQMEKARLAFIEALQSVPATLGAAGWQLNRHVPALEEQMGFRYASDVRGRAPFFPVMDGVVSRCMQLPTTLPTLDEIIGINGVDSGNAHQSVIQRSKEALPHGHVYTLHAELEGMKLINVMQSLLSRWKAAGWRFLTLGQLYQQVKSGEVPTKPIIQGEVAGRSGLLAIEGP